MGSIDRWALHRLQGVIERTERSYDTYVYHNVSREVYSFLSSDLSAFYLDVVKDRLYTSLPDAPARRSAQTALCELARCLSIILSPILVHTMEEVWSHLPGARDEICSVHLCEFPPVRTALLDEALSHRWDSLFLVRREVQRVLDAVRREGNIRNTREAALQIRCPSSLVQDVEGLGEDLAQLFIVSKVEMVSDDSAPGVRITVLPAEGTKCSRCWMVLPSVGEDGEFPTLCARCGSVVRQWPIT
jgi:isoleucyl-tRNA synthetase